MINWMASKSFGNCWNEDRIIQQHHESMDPLIGEKKTAPAEKKKRTKNRKTLCDVRSNEGEEEEKQHQ